MTELSDGPTSISKWISGLKIDNAALYFISRFSNLLVGSSRSELGTRPAKETDDFVFAEII